MPTPPPLPGDLVRIRDERWTVARHTPGVDAAVLDVRGRDRTNLGAHATFLLPFEIVERLPSSQTPRLVRARHWRRLTRAMLADATPSWEALRAPLHARIALLAFQLEPALAVTQAVASRLLIADEVGLGKTIQAGLVIREILDRSRHGRVLVVAPASLKEQWRAELHARFGVDAWLADSASLARLGAAWRSSFNPWSAHAVTITSIDFVKRPEVMRALEALVWDAVVFDEAHALAGRSDRATAAGGLADRARTVVMLTATPHTGDDHAFGRLCRIGDLDGESPLLLFRRTRRDVGLVVSRRTTALRVRPSLAEGEMHRELMAYARKVWTHAGPSVGAARLAMTVLTRRACSSAASLVRSVERRLALLAGNEAAGMQQLSLPWLNASDDEEPGAELAAPGLSDSLDERRHLETVLRLARRAEPAESKRRALVRFLRHTREPAIVFTEYRDTLTRLVEALREFEPVTLHGGLTAAERRESLRRFTAGDARLLIATDAASEGLNLQERCRLVINLELPWTPLRLEQRIGRVERIGQPRRVHAVHLLAAGTTEESTVAALLLRMQRVTEFLDSLRPPATEEQVAGAAIGQEPFEPAARSSRSSAPAHILAPRLHATALIEAARLERLRSLSGRSRDVPSDLRPPVAMLHRRRGSGGCLWGFHLVCADADQRPVWETLLGVASTPQCPMLNAQCSTLNAQGSMPNAQRLGTWIELSARLLEPALAGEQQKALAALASSLERPLALASRREQAIADAIAAQRARLSASLLQRGLFDRRAERLLAAQGAVLDEALDRCRARIGEIARTERVVVERLRLAFAVIRR